MSMGFSPQFIHDAKAELERIEVEYRLLGERRALLRSLLASSGEPVAPVMETTPEVLSASMVATSSAPFKEVITGMIRLHPGIKVRDMTKQLKAQKFPLKGQTDIGHRVYNEVWRLKNKGEVVQTPDGGYRLA